MNRSFTARLSTKTPPRLKDYLWSTHRLFNESLAYLLKHYFWMQNLTDREPEQDQKNRLRERFRTDPAHLASLRLAYLDLMGLPGDGLEGLPKDKRAGRSQNAHAWMEPLTYSTRSKGGEKSTTIHPQVIKELKEIRAKQQWLFDRELALPVSPDSGFRRAVFQSAARRILNFEQNEDTHRTHFEDATKRFERWRTGQQEDLVADEAQSFTRTGWKRTVLTRAWTSNQSNERASEQAEIAGLTWADFERAQTEFVAEERRRAAVRAREHGFPVDATRLEKLNSGMTRGWRDIYERLCPPEADRPPDPDTAEQIIKAYQANEPRRIGDVNLFLWLADKPHLWRFVETMRRYNDLQRRLEQYSRPIQFRYPRYNRRPEWFSFSETSPGHMYTIVSMHPMTIELSVLVPKEDVAVLQKLGRGEVLDEREQALLHTPIDWKAYHLSPEALRRRRESHCTAWAKKKGETEDACLEQVRDWTDRVWELLMAGFFRHDAPLDLSRFERLMVRYTMAADVRLRPFSQSPLSEEALAGRLVVEDDQRQPPHWQGKYRFWFGPLDTREETLTARRRLMRPMPLTIGGIRLEYRGRIQPGADPLFTLSCDLDERVEASDGKLVFPAPLHRIPKRNAKEDAIGDAMGSGSPRARHSTKRRRLPAGLRLLSIDLGLRHIAAGAVIELADAGDGSGVLPKPFKPIAVEFMDVGGITLSHIQRHQDERKRKQRRACPRGIRRPFEIRGSHLPRGQEFARGLLEHVENLKDDRRKKAAHAIVRAAMRHQVDYILFENLTGYRPDAEFGHRVNAALMTWNRRELVEFVRMEASPLGIYVYDWVPPHHTSRFCHRCGGAGHRFTHLSRTDAAKDRLGPSCPSISRDGTPILDAKGKQVFRPKWAPDARRVRGTPLGLIAGMRQAIDGGKHFCCIECGLMVNADYNAAMNLTRKLADDFPAYAKYGYNADEKTWLLGGVRMDSKTFWAHVRASVQNRLNGRFEQAPETPPAAGWPKFLEPAPESVPF